MFLSGRHRDNRSSLRVGRSGVVVVQVGVELVFDVRERMVLIGLVEDERDGEVRLLQTPPEAGGQERHPDVLEEPVPLGQVGEERVIRDDLGIADAAAGADVIGPLAVGEIRPVPVGAVVRIGPDPRDHPLARSFEERSDEVRFDVLIVVQHHERSAIAGESELASRPEASDAADVLRAGAELDAAERTAHADLRDDPAIVCLVVRLVVPEHQPEVAVDSLVAQQTDHVGEPLPPVPQAHDDREVLLVHLTRQELDGEPSVEHPPHPLVGPALLVGEHGSTVVTRRAAEGAPREAPVSVGHTDLAFLEIAWRESASNPSTQSLMFTPVSSEASLLEISGELFRTARRSTAWLLLRRARTIGRNDWRDCPGRTPVHPGRRWGVPPRS
ncbi:hypothetical protein PLANTIT3_80178 [Plantibacter sp. T3]|nr:hypothetical protein PLANTIT3_80178 [Plantibacter sp. T3]